MIADSSAVLAVILGEVDAEHYLEAMAAASTLAISAASFTEALIVAEAKQGSEAAHDVHALLAELECGILAVDEATAALAAQAWLRFGASRHVADLNFGECLAYATAKSQDLPLLYKQPGFRHTDIVSAM